MLIRFSRSAPDITRYRRCHHPYFLAVNPRNTLSKRSPVSIPFRLCIELTVLFASNGKTAWLIQKKKKKKEAKKVTPHLSGRLFFHLFLRCRWYWNRTRNQVEEKPKRNLFRLDFSTPQHKPHVCFLGHAVFNFLLHYARKELVNYDEMQIM